jgi:predicted nucleic acid-binding Zn ribbon protein
MLSPKLEVCAYRHCKNEFRPKREAQRFCSERCRKDYHYDVTRTSKKRRKRRLWAGVLGSVETEVNSLRRSISYEEGVHPSIALKCGPPVVDLVGIDPELLALIVKIECGTKSNE